MKNLLTLMILLSSLIYTPPVVSGPNVPVTGVTEFSEGSVSITNNSAFTNFILSVTNGKSYSLVGIYSAGVLDSQILQQPSGNPGFVSTLEDSVTQFSLASDYGSIGLVAHNYLAGMDFFSLKSGEELSLVYGNGNIKKYKVAEIRTYQALSPYSPYSNFINLSDTSVTLSATDLFYETYGQKDHLILQTCLERDGVDSWGRLFVIAVPLD